MNTQLNDGNMAARARDNIGLISQRLIDSRNRIRELTSLYGYESVFKITDDDWKRITGFQLSARIPYETVLRQDRVSDLMALAFSID